jgi:hypothetical protein
VLDIVIAGLLLVLILASILRRGIQQFILLGLVVLLGVVAIARIPGRFTEGLTGAGNQTIQGEVLRARPAFDNATRSIGMFLSQLEGDSNLAVGPDDSLDGSDGSSSDEFDTSSPENSTFPDSTIPDANEPQRAWW